MIRRIPPRHSTYFILTKAVFHQPHCVFIQVVIFPIFLLLLLGPINASVTWSPQFLPRRQILLLNHNKTFKRQLVKPSFLPIYSFINLVRDFFPTLPHPSGAFFRLIEIVCYLLGRTMASRS